MSFDETFAANYSLEPPGGLPEELRQRLTFLSCLREKDTSGVYLAEERGSGEKMILKTAGPGAPNDLAREYDLLRKLDHPGIPRPVSIISTDDKITYLLKTYAEGDTLSSLLERDGVFSERQTLEIAQKVCEIIEYLHSRTPPVIYRDITPDNVVITPNGKLSLIDFGISREYTADKKFDTGYMGSAAFAAPEQFGFTKTDTRSDIFTIGKLMLYLAAGSSGLRPDTERIEAGGLRKIIEKCTRISPEKRYPSVARLYRAIKRRLYPPTRREYLTAAVCMLLVLCVGIPTGLRFLVPPVGETEITDAPLSAAGDNFAEETKIPVLIEVLRDGKPFSDCAVAVDNHHWYEPAISGKARLYVYAYDSYRVRAASENRVAMRDTAVTRESSDLSFTLDLSRVPKAPAYVSLTQNFGINGDIPLAVEGADAVSLIGAPEGVSVSNTGTVNDGGIDGGSAWILTVDGVEQPGHYTVFAECTNEYGLADMVISLNISNQQEITHIRTAQDLDRVRDNLAGHYALANDIDLSEFGSWTPIGTDLYPFTGVLDGGGFSVAGLTIDSISGNAGIFGKCERAVIKNIVLKNPDIKFMRVENRGIAALVGNMEKGLIDNCAVDGGSIEADSYFYTTVGGICGKGDGTIVNCVNSASIYVTDLSRAGPESMTGGICGESAGYIAGCGNTGDITNTAISGALVGGITALCNGGIVTRCYNTGKVSAVAANGHYPPGGIVHLLGALKCISYSAFLEGAAPVGATVYNGGVLLGIEPLSAAAMQEWIAANTPVVPDL